MREVALIVNEVEVGADFRWCELRSETEIGGDRVGIDDLPWIHFPVGVPNGFELAERLADLRPEHLRQKLRFGLPVAVLS